MKKLLLTLIIAIPLAGIFFTINTQNYSVYQNIQKQKVNHPSLIPNSETAAFTSFGFKNLMADMYWLRSIQYIGQNVVGAEYKKYLSVVLWLITDLNPYFEKPYVIGELLLPSFNPRYEDLSESEQHEHIIQGEKLWLKGVENFCDKQKVARIRDEYDFTKILSEFSYRNPCKSYQIPYYLAYLYFYYLEDYQSASTYYKVVAAQDDAPVWAKWLAAIMQWRWGQREKSVVMFLSLAKSIATPEDSVCLELTNNIETLLFEVQSGRIPFTGAMLEAINQSLASIIPPLTEENESEIFWGTKCLGYVAKAVRELNIYYLSEADTRYKADHNGQSAQTAQILKNTWYIDYIPNDYQKYDDGTGIIYRYNPDIDNFDFEMWFE